MAKTYEFQTNQRKTTYDKRRNSGTPYVHGATVPKVAPLEAPTPVRKPSPRREVAPAVRRNRKHAVRFNLMNLSFLIVAFGFMAIILVGYINVQAEMTTGYVTNSSLEKQLENIKRDNDERENRILASVNLDDVERIAKEELGMRHPAEGQVVSYQSIQGDYVRQLKDIPID